MHISAATLIITALTVLSATAGATQADEPTALFNGRDLTGWTYHLADPNISMDDVWSVKEGKLLCTGKPTGYLLTKKNDFENYVLSLEWRWPEKGGNNGVLVHVTDPGALGVWPKSLEVQLGSGDAGDFWVIGTTIDVPNAETRRKDRRHLNLTDDSEKPLGEWNEMEIACRGNEVIVRVNGKLVNHATNVSQTKGAIALQSEGTPIEFRNIKLKLLKEAAKLIVPGERVGSYILGHMTLAQILGTDTPAARRHFSDQGITFEFNRGRELTGVTISTDQFMTKQGLKVGSLAKDVRTAFGDPPRRQPKDDKLELHALEYDGITFILADDRIAAIRVHVKKASSHLVPPGTN